jgi:hypothetical protein
LSVLRVTAVRVASVEKVHDERPESLEQSLHAFKKWRSYCNGQDADDTFTRTLIQGYVSERFARDPVLPGHVVSIERQKQAVRELLEHENAPAQIHEDMVEVLLKCRGRVFMNLEGGCLGITLGRTRAGKRQASQSALGSG